MLKKSTEKFFETVNIDFKSNPGRLWSVLKINSKTRSIPELVSMETGHQTSTNMTSQAGSSSSASFPSHKHRSKSSLLCASSSEAKSLRRFRKQLQKLTSNMEFTLHLHSKREDYPAATFITCIGSEALDILVYPIKQDIKGFCFASKEEKGRVEINLSFLVDVFLGLIQNIKETCSFGFCP